MNSEEIIIRCTNDFNLLNHKGDDTGILIKKNKTVFALKHSLDNGKFFYNCEVSGYMFDTKDDSFNRYFKVHEKKKSL